MTERSSPDSATHMRRPEYLTAWKFDGSVMPIWLIRRFQSTPLPENRRGHYATAVDGDFWRWFEPEKFHEMFVRIPDAAATPPDSGLREAIGKIIDPQAFQTVLPASSYNALRKADAIIALLPRTPNAARAAATTPMILGPCKEAGICQHVECVCDADPSDPAQAATPSEPDARYWEFRQKVENLVFDPIRRGGRVEDEILAELERMSLRDAEALRAPEPDDVAQPSLGHSALIPTPEQIEPILDDFLPFNGPTYPELRRRCAQRIFDLCAVMAGIPITPSDNRVSPITSTTREAGK